MQLWIMHRWFPLGEYDLRCVFRRIVFFSGVVKEINDRYPQLFGKNDEEGTEEGKGQDSKDSNTEKDGGSQGDYFTSKWGWLRTVDIVCEITRTSLWDVYKLPIMVTLNLYCYHIDKSNFEKSQIDDWKRKH